MKDLSISTRILPSLQKTRMSFVRMELDTGQKFYESQKKLKTSLTISFFSGMRKTRRKQLVESKGRKTGRKLTRRIIIECKLVE